MVAVNEINLASDEIMAVMTDVKIDDRVRDEENTGIGVLFIRQVMVTLRQLAPRGGFCLSKARIDQVEPARIGEVEVASSAMQAMTKPDFSPGAQAGPAAAEVAACPVLCKAVRIWSANHASGRDVSQSPSNLG
jgi:hypothetical protein